MFSYTACLSFIIQSLYVGILNRFLATMSTLFIHNIRLFLKNIHPLFLFYSNLHTALKDLASKASMHVEQGSF